VSTGIAGWTRPHLALNRAILAVQTTAHLDAIPAPAPAPTSPVEAVTVAGAGSGGSSGNGGGTRQLSAVAASWAPPAESVWTIRYLRDDHLTGTPADDPPVSPD